MTATDADRTGPTGEDGSAPRRGPRPLVLLGIVAFTAMLVFWAINRMMIRPIPWR